MTFIRLVALAVGVVLISACASFTPPARKHELVPGSSYWFDYDAHRRGALMVVEGSAGTRRIRTCAEPAPDVVLSSIVGGRLSGESKPANVEGELSGLAAQDVVKLTERSQMLMFFREALFRVCEISLNQELSPQDLLKMYDQIIATALRLGSDKAFEVDILLAEAEVVRRKQELAIAQERVMLARQAEREALGREAIARATAERELAQRAEQAAAVGLATASQQLAGLMVAGNRALPEASDASSAGALPVDVPKTQD